MPLGAGLVLKAGGAPGQSFIVISDNGSPPLYRFWVRTETGTWSLAAGSYQSVLGPNSEGPNAGWDAITFAAGPSRINVHPVGFSYIRDVSDNTVSPVLAALRSADLWASVSEGTIDSGYFDETIASGGGRDAINSRFNFTNFGGIARSSAGRLVTGIRGPHNLNEGSLDEETQLIYSDDNGATWLPCSFTSAVVTAGGFRRCYEISYSPSLNRFVAAALLSGGVQPAALYSDDGITWDLGFQDTGIVRVSYASVWDGTYFVVIAMAATGQTSIYRSLDGITWDARFAGISAGGTDRSALHSATDRAGTIVYGNDGVGGTQQGTLWRSTDNGLNWASVLASTTRCRAVKYVPKEAKFYMGRINGTVFSSANGASGSWAAVTMPVLPAGTRQVVAMAFPDP